MRMIPVRIGDRFGRLTITRLSSSRRGRIADCACDCGGVVATTVSKLNSGHTASCGCIRKEKAAALKSSHGHAAGSDFSPEYRVWRGVIARCTTRSSDTNKAYVHRGITVCDRWRLGDAGEHGFTCFLKDMGHMPAPGYSIERRDNSKGYQPGNCCWIPRGRQNRNKRNTRWVEIAGWRMSFVEAVERFGQVSASTAYMRVHRGWPDERAILTPIGGRASV